MANWIKLPDNQWLNLDNVSSIKIKLLTNPSNNYVILAETAGGYCEVANGVYQESKAILIVETLLQAGGVFPSEVPTELEEPSQTTQKELTTHPKNFEHG